MGSQLAERFGASQISSTAKIVEVDTAAHTITSPRCNWGQEVVSEGRNGDRAEVSKAGSMAAGSISGLALLCVSAGHCGG